jgi:hypothetical protein
MRSVLGSRLAWENRHRKDKFRQQREESNQRDNAFWQMPKGFYVCPRCELEGTFIVRDKLACPGCMTRMNLIRTWEKPKKEKRKKRRRGWRAG